MPIFLQVFDSGDYIEHDSFDEKSKHWIHSILYTTHEDEVICLFSDTTDKWYLLQLGQAQILNDRYRDAIHRLFVQRLGGTNDADDLLQETFIKVYINLHRYSTSYTFGQWVYTIARNTFIDFVRRRQEDLPIDDRFTSPASSAPTPEESVINLQQRTQIEHYLERLTPRYRQLILMRFFEEFAKSGTLPTGLSMWIPNILYCFIAIYLYKKAPK